MNKKNYITLAKKSADIQINELKKVKKIFNNSFIKAVDLILNCKGKVIFAGIGKSGLIARKVSATFSSVGIPSFFCDPAQALHGDMGQIEKRDILIIFSYSGNTSELNNMLKYANCSCWLMILKANITVFMATPAQHAECKASRNLNFILIHEKKIAVMKRDYVFRI